MDYYWFQVIAKDVSEKQKSCEADLAKAEPALLAAQEALNTLNKNNLTELKSFGSPPGAVVNVTSAVMVLLCPPNKIPKDRSWKNAKIMMAKVGRTYIQWGGQWTIFCAMRSYEFTRQMIEAETWS